MRSFYRATLLLFYGTIYTNRFQLRALKGDCKVLLTKEALQGFEKLDKNLKSKMISGVRNVYLFIFYVNCLVDLTRMFYFSYPIQVI